MPFQPVTFANAAGQILSGRLDVPVTGDPIGYALYASCFTCTKGLKAIGRITEVLALHGIATLRFDYTGLGGSEGDFADTNFSTNVTDLVAAGRFLADEYGSPEIAVGHSLGGAVVLAAADQLPTLRAIATIAAPASPAHIKRHISDDLDEIRRQGAADVRLAGRSFTIREHLLDDVEQVDLQSAIAGLGRPLLVIHSPIDNVVGVENAATILDQARHPKSFLALDGADHLITDDADARYVADVIASWSSRYIAGDLTSHAQPDLLADSPESETVVRIEDGFRTDVIANGFPLVADEPESVGGTNTGPTPYDYLLTALGTCTAMTLRMYSDKKAWQLEAVTVRLRHSKVHARDCAECESKGGYIDHIERTIDIVGALDDQQRQRLVEIADRCPVHKTLHGEVVVHTTLAAS